MDGHSLQQGGHVELIQPVIAIVDDDASLRRALSRLMHASGWKTVVFASAEAFVQTGFKSPRIVWCSTYGCPA